MKKCTYFEKTVALLLASVMVFLMIPFSVLPVAAATTSGVCGSNLTWSLNTDTGVLTISGTGEMKNYPSRSATPWYGCEQYIKSVNIGNSVTSIGNYAFSQCTSLRSLGIGNSVTSIGKEAFSSCFSLEGVWIPSSVTTIGENAFYGCTGLTSVSISSLGSWCGIEYSNRYSNPLYYAGKLFKNNELITDLVIPDNFTSIGDFAFAYCKTLTSVTIPHSVMRIGENAFASCSNLKKFMVDGSNENYQDVDGNLYSKDGKTLIQYAIGKTESNFTIADGVTSIVDEAFKYCGNLTSVTIPNSVASVGKEAFAYCDNLTSLIYCGTEAEWNAVSKSGNWNYSVPATVQFHPEHSFVDGVCSVCGATHIHAWSDGVITTEPTHTTEGVKTYTCPCGDTYTESVAKLEAHEWDNGVITTEPTHMTEGVKTYTCPCGDTYTEPVAKLTEHTNFVSGTLHMAYEDGEAVVIVHFHTCECGELVSAGMPTEVYHCDPTHTEAGAKAFSCEVCDRYHALTMIKIPRLPDHEWNDGVITTEPTHTTEGVKTYSCPCGDTYTEPVAKLTAHQWDDGVVTTAPTYETEGEKTYTCPCGATKTEAIPSLEITEETPKLMVDGATARAGEQIEIPVWIQNNPGMAGLVITVEYDTNAMTLVKAENGRIMSDMTAGKNLVFANTYNATADGMLVTLTFEVKEEAAEGDYAVKCVVRECGNEAMESVALASVAGTVSVVDFLYGDANGDGKVNLNDAILVRLYLANYDYGAGVSTVEVSAGADANGDGVVNLNDAILLSLYLANYDYTTGESDVILGPAR